MISSIVKAEEAKLKAAGKKSRAKQSGVKKERTGLLREALSGDNARSVKQAILFERSEFNRL
ncbi:hypothetical protein [Bacteroides ihuae]|uniref:hypothetical protein n=1 Tax=Bacteroides ihuae TaxID=1852362 RepID=UPI0008D92869|nr:hypothetical protein [Bacteroides ihuae]